MDRASLEAFIALERAGNFTQGARSLALSQPAFSRRIAAFEDELGVTLVERRRGRAASAGARRVTLTEAGRAILPHAEAAVASLQDLLDSARSAKSSATATVTLAISDAMCRPELLSALQRFGRAGATRLILRTGKSSAVSELVRRREAALGLRFGNSESSYLSSTEIGVQKTTIVCSAKHRLLQTPNFGPEDLANETWIGLPTSDEPDGGVRAVLLKYGLRVRSIIPINDFTAQMNLIQQGFGIGFTASENVQSEVRAGRLAILEIPGLDFEVPVTLITRRHGHLSKPARALISLIKRDFGSVLSPG